MLKKNLADLLEKGQYDGFEVNFHVSAKAFLFDVNFISSETRRILTFKTSEPFLDSEIWILLTRDYLNPSMDTQMDLKRFLIPKSNGKISEKDFQLQHYAGEFEQQVAQYCQFLKGQLNIRGSHFVAGTGWSLRYHYDWSHGWKWVEKKYESIKPKYPSSLKKLTLAELEAAIINGVWNEPD